MRRFNPLGLLALLSVIAVLGFLTDNKGWFGFFGFFYYIRYFWVLPDEFFLENVRKTATLSFFASLLSLILYVFLFCAFYDPARAAAMAFGLSFATSVIVFSLALALCEWREQRGARE